MKMSKVTDVILQSSELLFGASSTAGEDNLSKTMAHLNALESTSEAGGW